MRVDASLGGKLVPYDDMDFKQETLVPNFEIYCSKTEQFIPSESCRVAVPGEYRQKFGLSLDNTVWNVWEKYPGR